MGTHPIFESDFDCLTEWEIQSSRISHILNKWVLPLSRLPIPVLLLQWVLHQLTEMFTVSNLVHLLQAPQLQVLNQHMRLDTLNNRQFTRSHLLTELRRQQ